MNRLKTKKIIGFLVALFLIFTIGLTAYGYFTSRDITYMFKKRVVIDKLDTGVDKDKDGISDLEDIVQGARKEVRNKTKYKDVYHAGGYPPDDEGVCTDVIWRALKNAGYDLKASIDKDIRVNMKDYANSVTIPDPNIDFRRVKNLYVFFSKYAQKLTTDVIPYDKENLEQWQGGDIVIYGNQEHIAIISDKRRRDGVPYIIHNASTYAKEEDRLLAWKRKNKILAHFRYPKN